MVSYETLKVIIIGLIVGFVWGIKELVVWFTNKKKNEDLGIAEATINRRTSWTDTTGEIRPVYHSEFVLFQRDLTANIADIRNRQQVYRHQLDELQSIVKPIKDLWEWHKREDEDGVKVWYVSKGFRRSVLRLADAQIEGNKLIVEALNKLETALKNEKAGK